MIKRGLWLSITTVVILVGMSLFGLIQFNEDSTVSAAEAQVADEAGYSWIDSLDPSPKVQYEWIDISDVGTGLKTNLNYYTYYTRYYYYYCIDQDIGFDFPFYDKTFSSLQVYPNGVLGFGASTYNYAPYNRGGAFPSTYSYTPPGTIAPYWCYYAAPYRDDDDSDIWVYQDQTQDGMKYWICSWVDVNYYYTDDSGATFQVILYENGDIKVNIKESKTYSTSYFTIGIQNLEMDIGLTYNYQQFNQIEDEQSILFKQFRSDVISTDFSEGFGPDKEIYPAMSGMGDFNYYARANLYSEKGVEKLDELKVDFSTGPDVQSISLIYDFQGGKFRKINDGLRQMAFNPSECSVYYPNATDMVHFIGVEFRYDFNSWWTNLDGVDITMTLTGIGLKGSSWSQENVFDVETGVTMAGNLSITDSKGKNITKGNWVKGGDVIHFKGVHREYVDLGDEVEVPDFMEIALEDQNAKVYKGKTSDLDVSVEVDPKYSNMDYRLVFLNVSTGIDKTPTGLTEKINLKVDSDMPSLPGNLEVYPDDPEQPPLYYDDDREIYLKWEESIDSSSGVARYHISVNVPQSKADNTMITQSETTSYTIRDLEEGNNKIYVWAEDNVGNLGGQMFTNVIIDLSEIEFADFYPQSGEWLTNQRPTCSVLINDTLTGVDPLTLEYQVSNTGEQDLNKEETWKQIQESYAPDNTLRVVVVAWFTNGQDNYIWFRAKDLAGNGYTTSDKYNVWVDAEGPRYKMISPTTDYQPSRTVDVSLEITDPQSGVDASTIEYRYSTQGVGKFTPWKPYKEGEDGKTVIVRITETFRRGDNNFIQVRGKDLAGNPLTTSEPFRIYVNTVPDIEILSPSQSDIIYENQRIIFDATPSYDPDGDEPTIWWYSSLDNMKEPFSKSAYAESKEFYVGEHTITVIAEDDDGEQAQLTFTINVRKEEQGPIEGLDTDGDGLPDSWEQRYSTDHRAKDESDDPDLDGFTNMQEYENGTHPMNELSHPPIESAIEEDEFGNIFDNWLLWLLLAVLLIVILITMLVTKARKDKAVKRIRTVHNMKRIMPSVSWEQIQTTTYMAPGAGATLPGAAQGPALPQAQAAVSPESALPPAQQAEGAQPEGEQAYQAAPGQQQYQGQYQQEGQQQYQAQPQEQQAAQPEQYQQAYQAAPAQQQPQQQYQAQPQQQYQGQGNYDPNQPGQEGGQ